MRLERAWTTLRLRLRTLLQRGRMQRELDEEMQFHLDHLIEDGLARGLSPAEARAAALRTMGGLTQRKEEVRDMWGLTWLTDLADDLRFAARSLMRARALTLFVVMALALGIGMTAASFSMLDALVFRPYPVPDPGRVVTLVSTSRDNAFEGFSHREFRDLEQSATSYDGLVASGTVFGVGYSPDARTSPRVKAGMLVSGDYFRVLGVEPSLGRSFRADEDRVPDRDAVVVLAHAFWRQELSGDPQVVGRRLRINGREFTVIGVAPESFPGMFIFSRNDFFLPLAMGRLFEGAAERDLLEDRDARALTVRGRLRRDVSLAEARHELAGIAAAFARSHPDLYRGRGASVRTQLQMRTQANDVNWKFGLIFTLLSLCTLLVACTNVAGLLLSRARARTREIAVRLALGAGRTRLVRFLLAESLLLSGVGGAAGVGLGYVAIQALRRFSIPADLPMSVPFQMDVRVLLACVVLAVASAVLCGLAPALQSTRADVAVGLRTADIDPPGRRSMWGRNALVVSQVALSLALLTATFLMARSFQHSVRDAAGLDRGDLLMARLDPRLLQYDPARTQRFYTQLTERMRQMPGVVTTALTQNPPLGLDAFERLAFVPEGYDMPRDRETLSSQVDAVDDGYFAALDIAIRSGRGFTAHDDSTAPRVAIVNEHMARHYWPDGDAVGRTLRIGGRDGTPVEIVGVAQTVSMSSNLERPDDFVYLPLAQRPAARMVMLVRTTGDPLAMVGAVREAVRAIEPDLPILELRTYDDLVRYSMVEGPAVAVRMVGTMGLVGVFLAVAGLYGLVSYHVARRTREIGIRMAIGASHADVMRLVLGRGLTLVAIGTGLGLLLGFAVERMIDSMLFATAGIDFVSYAIVVPLMLAATLLATWLPARRALRIEPTVALRCE